MAYLQLQLSEFNSSFGVGGGIRPGWRANWKAGMTWSQSVKLSNGSDLAEMRGWLNLKSGDLEPTEDNKAIGALSYFPADNGSDDGVLDAQPETYYVEVVLPEPQLLRLMELERQGHGPTGVSVDVPKLRYGHFPDGSDKSWDLSEDGHDWLAVEGLTFSFAKAEPEVADEDADEPDEIQTGPSAEVRAMHEIYRDFQKWAMWLCGLLAAILITLWLKR